MIDPKELAEAYATENASVKDWGLACHSKTLSGYLAGFQACLASHASPEGEEEVCRAIALGFNPEDCAQENLFALIAREARRSQHATIASLRAQLASGEARVADAGGELGVWALPADSSQSFKLSKSQEEITEELKSARESLRDGKGGGA